ncbi:ABC transporter substrate-binding protein [Haematobacter missouriensis]|uniref:ABC transporter substrate-binding protein n=1 Tax=Haematobacter missouriensis TaxID=366616 RepID=A0A212ALP1_9RHOB|nr:ABC transporter substrate-binding protein [Haematobacter missouriensis]KFI32466.1 ABC transporter substrate-binding protein [Haematobacter missouriensis]OWJ76462.1 ABC transporter substrate-binding protein [Haematobacter missouriensis]OWJ82266.1 ABC transporter substrate-binding protein [Haematobacter missouriensis]
MPPVLLRTLLIALLGALSFATSVAAAPFRIIVTDTEAPLVPNSLLNLAAQEGYFTREGVEVELVSVRQTPMAVAALQSGSGEMANISLEALLALHREGVTDIVAVHSSDKSLPFVIAARKDVTLDTLTGGTFGIGQPNSLDHTLSAAVLAARGVSLDALTLVPIGQPAARGQALMAGRVDATTLSIGSYLSLPDRSGLHLLVDVQDYFAAAPVVSKVNVVKRVTLETRADDLDRILTALTRAARDFAARPELWTAAMAKARPDVSHETLEQLTGYYAGNWTVNGGVQRSELLFAQTWYERGMDQNSRYIADPARWLSLAPMDGVLRRLGVSDLGDTLSR